MGDGIELLLFDSDLGNFCRQGRRLFVAWSSTNIIRIHIESPEFVFLFYMNILYLLYTQDNGTENYTHKTRCVAGSIYANQFILEK